jgi:hypothetical protein
MVYSPRQFVAGSLEELAILSHYEARKTMPKRCRSSGNDYQSRGLIVTIVCPIRHQ